MLWRRSKTNNIKVAYLCDHKACDGCSIMPNSVCNNTTDIRHAVNFKKLDDEHYIEVADISRPITK